MHHRLHELREKATPAWGEVQGEENKKKQKKNKMNARTPQHQDEQCVGVCSNHILQLE